MLFNDLCFHTAENILTELVETDMNDSLCHSPSDCFRCFVVDRATPMLAPFAELCRKMPGLVLHDEDIDHPR